jgi:hypothetical protein
MLRVGANSDTLLPELNKTPRAVSQPVETEKNGLVVGFPGKKTTARESIRVWNCEIAIKPERRARYAIISCVTGGKRGISTTAGLLLSPGPAVPRGEHFDENHTGER